MKMVKILKFLLTFLLFFGTGAGVQAIDGNLKDLYNEQLNSSGYKQLGESIPRDVAGTLEKIGVSITNPESITDLNMKNVFDEINSVSNKNFKNIFSYITTILGVLMVCAAVKSFVAHAGKNNIDNILNCVCSICLCSCLVYPITKCISGAKLVILSASDFITALSGVMTAIMAASGKSISASSYSCLTLISGQAISALSSNFLLPIMNSVFGISVISSISNRIKIEKLCSSILKLIKTILKFIASLFVGLLTIQNIVASSADNLTISGTKLIVDSCIPIVGGAVSDAVSTIGGCLKLLKSGAGAFGILVGIFIFLPMISECIIWGIFLSICEFISDSFELGKISLLFKSTSEIIKTLLAILVCIIVVLISSTAIILIIGR